MSKTLFKITNGHVGLELVDTAAVGYLASWQGPGGVELPTLALSDYDADSASFGCQIVTGVYTATENVSTDNVEGTWCAPPEVNQTVGEDSFTIVWDAYQDPNNAAGLSAYLYQHRGKTAYVLVQMTDVATPDSPVAIAGVVTLKSPSIGGGRTANRMQVTLPFTRAADVQFGTAADWLIVYGDKGKPPLAGPPPLDDEGAELELEAEPA